MKNERKARSLSTVAALLVLALFALTILGVLLGGAGAYQRLVRRDRQTSDSRSAAQYLATKIRQASLPGEVRVLPFGDGCALQIPETADGTFVTRIYCHEGWLMELFCAADSDLLPRDGEKVLPAQGLEPCREGDLLTLTLTDVAGNRQELLLTLRYGEVVLP